jgi:peptide/nickel transport system permease protein
MARLALKLAGSVVTLMIAAFLGALLVWLAPGLRVDEQDLNAHLSAETAAAIRHFPANDASLPIFYFKFLRGLLHGDLGVSRTFRRPVAELVRGRWPVTVRSVCLGLALGWTSSLLLAVFAVQGHRPPVKWILIGSSTLFLSLPSALLALGCLLSGLPTGWAIALVIFPRIVPYAYNQLESALRSDHALAAHARGLSTARVFLLHVALPVAAPLLALAAVSVPLAFGAALPIEVVSDSPGLGQLAWKAAQGRDLTVLVSLTILLSAVTLVADFLSSLVVTGPRTEET